MPSTDLIVAATAAIDDAFGDTPLFSCLAGSTATDSDTSDSDIDLLVVLPNQLSVAEARQQRENFTRNYIRLHTAFGRAPDLQWPGEVCYASDLDDAISGGAFDLATVPQLRLGPEDQPYRYWASMCAAGIPLTGSAAFTDYSTRCLAMLINHIEYNRRYTSKPTSGQQPGFDPPEFAEWAISSAVADHRARTGAPESLRAWRRSLREPKMQPRLDRWIEHWRDIAAEG
ncbi:nucleotidyltransferase domain-containing protein [Nocardia cyriacigeorgica]|uniref:nucleotidyltransferase domain-containing protein n=1 Tax=Nocardia cyriacigeorgica TaxID=135487 RepID=UPI00245429C1|nr:nucleotidyltransferase domain-containing protein [Nocardia cyriacigeorgica]